MMLRIVLTSCAQSSPREAASRASSSRDGNSHAPSSAAVERIFSRCNHMFGDAQLIALADFVQGSFMLCART